MPTVQENVSAVIAYQPEVTFGVPPGAGTSKYSRRVSTSLVPNKDSFASNEVRPDQQVSDARHGTRRVGGSIEGEMSTQSYDDFIEACLRGTWTAGVTFSNTDFTSVAADSGASTFTFASGSALTKGLKVGDVIRFASLSESTNNGKNFTIIAETALVLTVTPAPTTMSADTTFTGSVVGSKLLMGVVKRSYTLDLNFPDIDVSEQLMGCRFGGLNASIPPNGMATFGFDVMGWDAAMLSGAGAPYYTSPAAAPNTGVLAGPNGLISIAGAASQIVTSLDFALNCNLSGQPVIGSNKVPAIFYGVSVVNGNLSAFFDSVTLANAFLNETDVELTMVLEDSVPAPANFLRFTMNRVKLMGMSHPVQTDGGVIISFPFQALLKSGGAGTAYDQSSLVIQRSN